MMEGVADLLGELRRSLGKQPKWEDGLCLVICPEEIVADSNAVISSYHLQIESIDSKRSAPKTEKGG